MWYLWYVIFIDTPVQLNNYSSIGKFWHRHRRPRPVEYNSDPDFHNGVKRDTDMAKTTAAAKKKGGAAALRAQSSTVPPTPAETSAPQTPTPTRSNGDIDMSSRQSPMIVVPPLDDDRAISPVSTASSASEPPLAQRIKLNGSNRHATPVTPTPAPVSAAPTPSPVTPVTPAPPPAPPIVPTTQDAPPPSHAPTPSSATDKPKAEPAAAPLTSPTRPWVRIYSIMPRTIRY